MYEGTRLYPLLALLVMTLALNCKTPTKTVSAPAFDTQGHRGARGLMPENTIPAMFKALDLGVTTLEMDVVISRDHQVVVSHDPYFSFEISTTPEGKTFGMQDQLQFNLYKMDYADIRKWDVGMKPVLRFPQQQKMKAYKPLLAELIDSVEAYVALHKLPKPHYNIETKSDLMAEKNGYQPAPELFSDLVMAVLEEKKILDRCIIQSFDERTIQYIHRKFPRTRLAYLVEGTEKNSIEQNLAKLGFQPDIYSPEHILVTPELLKYCHNRQIKVIPWTVNTRQRIEELKAMGVDGIISDYPNLF